MADTDLPSGFGAIDRPPGPFLRHFNWHRHRQSDVRGVTMTPRDRPAPAHGEMEITREMIEAGAEALHADPCLGDLPLMDCEAIARDVIERVLAACSRRSCPAAP